MATSYTMRCPSCGTVNRLPSDKEGVSGRCGACQAQLPVLHARPIPLDDASFDAFVADYGMPVLAEFWAPW